MDKEVLLKLKALKKERERLNEQLKTAPLDQRWRINDAICRISAVLDMARVA